MKTIYCSALLIALLAAAGCATLQAGGDLAYGRQALIKGNNEAAFGFFQRAAQEDPNYVYGVPLQQSVWSYVGRSEYLTGQIPQARQTLERVISGERVIAGQRQEVIARLYLGLTLAREGDREHGLKEIESGMRGINNFIDYMNQDFRYSFGQYFDTGRDIRGAIQTNLAMISGKDVDWQQLTTATEWLGIRMEEESDLARRQWIFDQTRDSSGNPSK
jgi:tetratricopeptide (TPR) repeat protein